MDELRTGVAVFLLLNVLAGLARAARGPTLADRLLVSQLVGTTGATVVLLLAPDRDPSSLLSVAVVLAILAPVTIVAYVRHAAPGWTGAGS